MVVVTIDPQFGNNAMYKAQDQKSPNKRQQFVTHLANQTQKVNHSQNLNLYKVKNPALEKLAQELEQKLYSEALKHLTMGLHEEKECEGGIMEEVFSQELMEQYAKQVVSKKNSRLAEKLYEDLNKMSQI